MVGDKPREMEISCPRGRNLILVHGNSRVDLHGLPHELGGKQAQAKVSMSTLKSKIWRIHDHNLDGTCMRVVNGVKIGYVPSLVCSYGDKMSFFTTRLSSHFAIALGTTVITKPSLD
jgi:hypothetical protein